MKRYLRIVGVAQLCDVIARQRHLTQDGQGVLSDELRRHQDVTDSLHSWVRETEKFLLFKSDMAEIWGT